jgi:hypothetical protein
MARKVCCCEKAGQAVLKSFEILHSPSCLYRYPGHLGRCPVLAHILSAQLMHLVVEMLPQDGAECVENSLEFIHAQLPLSTPAFAEIGFQLVESLVDLLVLSEQLEFFGKGGHLASKDGEDVALLDGVVDGEVVDEIVAYTDELAYGHAGWSLLALARSVKHVPRSSKVLMLQAVVSPC